MIEEAGFAGKRIARVSAMAAGLVILSVLYALHYHYTIDRILALLLFHGILFPLFLLLLYSERREGRLNRNPASSYRMICNVFLGMLVLYFAFAYFPAYYAPVIIPAVFLTGVSTPVVGMAGSIYLDILLCMVSEGSYYELAAYLVLSMSGCLLAMWLGKRQYRLYLGIVLFALSFAIPGLFYYFGSYERNAYMLIYGALSGSVSCLVVFLLFDRTSIKARTEVTRTLSEIIEPEFPLARDIRNFSRLDYAHAVNVSKTAYQCALLIGADADTASAAGFYYRLGKLEGEPFVKNGVLLAEANCFPVKVVEILREYNGEEQLPQTRESAIVHMVDAVVTKFELLDKDTVSNRWNHDMVIYQTLDEKSSSGIYDESGLSMNQYLKIREYLVKGVTLQ